MAVAVPAANARRRVTIPRTPLRIGAQLLAPSTNTSDWTDPNSVLQSVTRVGDKYTFKLKNPAASRDLPSSGASILIPLLNMRGEPTTQGDNMSMLQPIVTWDGATSIPAYTWFSVTPVTGASPTVTSTGIGHYVDGDGVGTRPSILVNTAGTWSILPGAVGYSSTARMMTGKRFSSTDGSTATNSTTQLLTADGTALNTRIDNTNRGLGAAPIVHAYVMVSVGWTSASGTTGAEIVVRPYMLAGRLHQIPGVT